MHPAATTLLTSRLIKNARPVAAIVDYFLMDSPNTHSEDLARNLIDGGIPTVLLTKDRDIADRSRIQLNGYSVPVFHKKLLVHDVECVSHLIQSLGGKPTISVLQIDTFERLSSLQEKALLSRLSRTEKNELDLLLARLRLEESEEAARVEQSQLATQEKMSSLINEIRQLTTELAKESKIKHAVRTKKKRP